jgi:murein DD-endopeptidase MepM/ murein hydrolase activator NlpD
LLVPVAILVSLLALLWRTTGGDGISSSKDPTPYGVISVVPTAAQTGSPAPILNDQRFLYAPGWGALEVREFLEGRAGVLGDLQSWVGDREMPLADVIAGQCFLYGVNPKVVLALLEIQSGLVDTPAPSPEDLDWAMGYQEEEERGLEAQIIWAVREIFRGMRDYPVLNTLVLGTGEKLAIPSGTNLGSYAVMRVVAQTGGESRLRRLEGTGEKSFVQTYMSLFDEDPRLPMEGLPPPADVPFLTQPYAGLYEVTSIFDHQYPFLSSDGVLLSRWGLESKGLPYDGHDGWDYALDFGVPVLAAADGVVAWSGNSDDGCATVARGVVLEHERGYHTIYWHLDRVDVQPGEKVSQGDILGVAGASGCAEGPHLHFGVRYLGRRTDPEGWCGSEPDLWASHSVGAESRWLWADRFSPCQVPRGAIIVDNSAPGFQQSGTSWFEAGGGVGAEAFWAPSEPRSGVVPVGDPGSLDGVVEAGTWRPDLPEEGYYRVYAFIPYWYNDTLDTRAARYVIYHAEGEDVVVVDQALHVDRWVDLGVFPFAAGRQGFVYLDNLTDETGFGVWFDAVVWLRE